MKKKLILILSMVALLVCVFAISASAASMDFISTKTTDDYEEPETGMITVGEIGFSNDNFSTTICRLDYLYICTQESNSYLAFIPAQFQNFVNTLMNSDNVSYSEFVSFVNNIDESKLYDGDSYALPSIKSQFNGFDEAYYNKIYFGETVITQEDLTAKYEEGKNAGYSDGFNDGYNAGLDSGEFSGFADGYNSFAEDLDNHFNDYVNSVGGLQNATPDGFSSYVSNSPSYDFFCAFNSNSIGSCFESFYEAGASSSSSSSHGGSHVTIQDKGENYGKSHNGDSDTIDTDCCYNPGYYDGVLDGGDTYKNSEQWDIDVNNEINEYMQSSEYQTLMNEYSTEVINEYLLSVEYQAAIDSSIAVGEAIGEANAYDRAYEEVLTQGRTEGYNSFRESQEYLDALDSSSYVGYKKGVEDGKNSVVDPTGVIALIVILAVLGFIVFIVSKKAHGKKIFKKK